MKYLPYLLVYLIISGASLAVLLCLKILNINSEEYIVFLNYTQVTTSFALFSLPTLIQIESENTSKVKVSIDKLLFQFALLISVSFLYINAMNGGGLEATLAVVFYGIGTISCYNLLYNWLSRNDLSAIRRFLIIPFIEIIVIVAFLVFKFLPFYTIFLGLGIFKLLCTLSNYSWRVRELHVKYAHYMRFGSVLAVNSFLVSSIISYDKLLFTSSHGQFYNTYVSNYFFMSIGIALVNLNNMYFNVELFKRKITFSNFTKLVRENFRSNMILLPLLSILIYSLIYQEFCISVYLGLILSILQIRHITQAPFLTAKYKELLLISSSLTYVLSFHVYPRYIVEPWLLYITMMITLIVVNINLIILISSFGGKRYNASIQ